MADRHPSGPRRMRRRLRLLLAWVCSGALVAGYYLIGDREEIAEPTAEPPAEVAAQLSDDLEIVEVTPSDPTPGSSVVIRYVGGNPKSPAPVRANLSESTPKGQIKRQDALKEDLEIL